MADTTAQFTPTIPTQRDAWFDNIKGILMLLVVVGHFIASLTSSYGSIRVAYKMINSFHMPCFMILTGFLSQRRIKQRDYGKIATRLVIPYFTAQLLIYICAALVPHALKMLNDQTNASINWFFPAYHLWFLCAIILFNLITPKLSTAFAKCPWLLFIIAVACSIGVGYCPEVNVLRLTKCIGYYPFFLLGFYCKKEWMQRLKTNRWIKVIAVVILLCFAAFFVLQRNYIYPKIFPLATPYAKYDPEYAELLGGNYPVIARCLFLVGAVLVSLAFMSLAPKKKTIFTHVGQRSMNVYVLHGILVIWIRTISKYKFGIYSRIDTWYEVAIFLLLCVVLTFVLASKPVDKLFGWILEPKINLPIFHKKEEK